MSSDRPGDRSQPQVIMPGNGHRPGGVEPSGTQLVLLGTSGGPPWWEGSHRRGTSSAVAVDGAVYLIDCGEGWGPQIRRAGLGASGYHRGLENLVGVFITHQHSDHTVDYPNLIALAWHNGGDLLTAPIDIYGPGDRTVLPPIYGVPDRKLPVVAPHHPTPGMVSLTRSLVESFATDLNDRIRDYHKRDLAEMFAVHDIELPPGSGDDPNGQPSPPMDPFVVHEDSRVKVTAILVDHAPVFPAFAFRFDTDAGSITFSGDTCPCDNLVRIAQGSDILVHEVIDRQWVETTFANRGSDGQALMHHLLAAHTTIEDVGRVAQEAGVSMLVLNHLIPGNHPDERWAGAAAGFDGQLVVGQDLMKIAL